MDLFNNYYLDEWKVPEFDFNIPEISFDLPDICLNIPSIEFDLPEIGIDLPEINFEFQNMGRRTTGAIHNKGAMRIELSYLLKQGFIKKNCNKFIKLSWSNGNNINLYTCYTNEEKYIRLVYEIYDKKTGEKEEFDYKIQIIEFASNLKKGKVLYFLCPESMNKCRILYYCYGSQKWKSIKAYNNRIYYESQMVSKYDYHNLRYWDIDKQIKEIESGRKSYFYKGKKTKRYLKLKELRKKQKRFDLLRWTLGMPKRLMGYINEFQSYI